MEGTPIFFEVIGKFFEQLSVNKLKHQLYILGLIACTFTILFNIIQSTLLAFFKIPILLIILSAALCDLIVVMQLRELPQSPKSIRTISLGVLVLLPALCQVPQSGVSRLVVYTLMLVKPKVYTWFFLEFIHLLLLYCICDGVVGEKKYWSLCFWLA